MIDLAQITDKIAELSDKSVKVLRNRIRNETMVCKRMPDCPAAMYDIGVGAKQECASLKFVWPHLQLFGCEPNPAVYFELKPKFPGELHRLAISEQTGDIAFHVARHNSLLGGMFKRPEHTAKISVPSITLDAFDAMCKRPIKLLLWIDVEGAEMSVLRSGRSLLESGRVLAINLEERRFDTGRIWPDDGWANPDEIRQFLTDLGFVRELAYNKHPGHQDVIYVKR